MEVPFPIFSVGEYSFSQYVHEFSNNISPNKHFGQFDQEAFESNLEKIVKHNNEVLDSLFPGDDEPSIAKLEALNVDPFIFQYPNMFTASSEDDINSMLRYSVSRSSPATHHVLRSDKHKNLLAARVPDSRSFSDSHKKHMVPYDNFLIVDGVTYTGTPEKIFKTLLKAGKIPESVDWSSPDVGVRNQGKCGSCFAVASAVNIQLYNKIVNNDATDVSIQKLMDCGDNELQCGGAGGCLGSIEAFAFDGIIDNGGFAAETEYPYISQNGGVDGLFGRTLNRKVVFDSYDQYEKVQAGDEKSPEPIPVQGSYECRADSPAIGTLTGYTELPQDDPYATLLHLAFNGPLNVGIAASSLVMYSGGIHTLCNKETSDINHAVVMVGYGQENGQNYFKIQNSWGENWGENGFFRLEREPVLPDGTIEPIITVNKDPSLGTACVLDPHGADAYNVAGACAIYSNSIFPIVQKKSAKSIVKSVARQPNNVVASSGDDAAASKSVSVNIAISI